MRENDFEAGRRLEAKLEYGLAAPWGRGVVTPYAGVTLSEAGRRTWRAGARWQVAPGTTLGLEGTRKAGSAGEAPENALRLRSSVRF